MSIMPDVVPVDAQLRLQFLGRDEMPPSLSVMMASHGDPAHDPNTGSAGPVALAGWEGASEQ
jgi:hypothetical protein